MKTAGWILIVFGTLAFLGAASKGHSVFGPSFWIGIGILLVYLKKEREEVKKQTPPAKSTMSKQSANSLTIEAKPVMTDVDQCAPITFEQKEAALCLVAFFAGYNDDIMTNDTVYMISYQSAAWFGIDNYREVITTAIPKYQDADKLIDTVLSIHDKKTKEFLLLTCYDLTKMSGRAEAYELLYNIANDMGYNRERLHMLIRQYSN